MISTRPVPIAKPGARCLSCGGPRKMPASRMHREHAARDPFCSNACARAWHENPLREDSIWSQNYGR